MQYTFQLKVWSKQYANSQEQFSSKLFLVNSNLKTLKLFGRIHQ